MEKGKKKERGVLHSIFHFPFSICHELAATHSDFAAEERELLLLLLVLDQDGGFDENEQDLLILGVGAVGKEAFEERDFAENGNALFALGFTGQGLTTEEQGCAVGNGAGGSDGGVELGRKLEGTGDQFSRRSPEEVVGRNN